MLRWMFVFLAMMGSLQSKEIKTLVLIICSDGDLYNEEQKIWRSYMHLDPEHFQSYFIRADPKLNEKIVFEGDVIRSRTAENLIPGILNKTLLSLEALPLDEFDYILRTNLSSFFVLPRLLKFLETAPQEHFYCGLIHGTNERKLRKNGWVCGAGIILSTDLAQLLLENKERLYNLSPSNFYNIDDVAISDFLYDHGIIPQQGHTIEIYHTNTWNQIKHKIPPDLFHFRIKILNENRLTHEIPIQRELVKMFYNK